ncbi:hypothetical protein BDB01DRAFT_785919 [Pilobolus umbonatus]|nr:hypothetical protein BDB01DRAFT_785919 [Pilobolus umbonatus]
MSSSCYFLGIDVGTGSVRAAIIDEHGQLVTLSMEPIETYHPHSDIFEQSATNIWSSIGRCVNKVMKNISPLRIKGIGFDATCSLVVLDKQGQPLSVDETSHFEDNKWNIILWADHRAVDEAKIINDTHHSVLDYVGKSISPEMEIPKTLWLFKHLPAHHWNNIGHLMDLPDYLTYKATGNTNRSICSLTCKFSYLPKGVGEGWDPDFLTDIGLKYLVDTKFKLLGGDQEVLEAGMPVGRGLSPEAAEFLGLEVGTPVGSALIDAYAGAVSTLGAASSGEDCNSLLAIISGTSSCHIAIQSNPIFIPGIWGPYRSVMLSNQWHAEAGQSSTGQLIDFIVTTHPAYSDLNALSDQRQVDIYSLLEEHLLTLQKRKQLSHMDELTKHIHVYPDFHGNRSPLADPTLRGMIVGLPLDRSMDDLAIKYLATLQSIAYQTLHIISNMNEAGYTIDTLCMSGGLCKNTLLMKILSDVTQCKIILPEFIEGAVVIGAAFLGAKASGLYSDNLWDIMVQMGRIGSTIHSGRDAKLTHFHQTKYKVYHSMLSDQKKYRQMME